MGNAHSSCKCKSEHDTLPNEHLFGVSHAKGRRPTQEDTHCIHPFTVNTQPVYLVAVFDGHGGEASAQYASTHMGHICETALTETNTLDPDTIGQQLQKAFLQIDEDLRAERDRSDNLKTHRAGEPPRTKDTSGCTAIVAIITSLGSLHGVS